MRPLAAAFALILSIALVPAISFAAPWKIDPDHSHLTFTVDNLGFSLTQGQFRKFSAYIDFDPENVETSSVSFVIDTNSVDTNSKGRDKSIRSKNYLNVKNFPEITFVSDTVRLIDDNTAEVKGEVTIRGETREATFMAEMIRIAANPFSKNTQLAGFAVTGVINRVEFGITYGAPAVGVDINVRLDLQLKEQK